MTLVIATNRSSIVLKGILTSVESAGAIQAKTLVRLHNLRACKRLKFHRLRMVFMFSKIRQAVQLDIESNCISAEFSWTFDSILPQQLYLYTVFSVLSMVVHRRLQLTLVQKSKHNIVSDTEITV